MKKTTIILLVALATVLLSGSAAFAATPQDIYDDYAADSDLDGTYTDAGLQAYLDDTTVDQYANPTVVAALDAVVRDLLAGVDGEAGDDEEDEDTFPFTGFEVALALLGGIALLGSGVVIRKWAR